MAHSLDSIGDALGLVMRSLTAADIASLAWCGSSEVRRRALIELRETRPDFKWKHLRALCVACGERARTKDTTKLSEVRCCKLCQDDHGWMYKTHAASAFGFADGLLGCIEQVEGLELRCTPNPWGAPSTLIRRKQAQLLGSQYDAIRSTHRLITARIGALNGSPGLVAERLSAGLPRRGTKALAERLARAHRKSPGARRAQQTRKRQRLLAGVTAK